MGNPRDGQISTNLLRRETIDVRVRNFQIFVQLYLYS